MSSQIPPLVCHTPPPMDFGDEDDEVDLPDAEEDDFDDFASMPVVAANTDLPTPVPPPLPDFEALATKQHESFPVAETVSKEEKAASTTPQAVIEIVLNDSEDENPRIESPPSLILSQHNYSETDLQSEDEFQDFAFHSHVGQEDCSIPPGSEDNISIPSLHLDTEVSKSGTPVQLSENETSERNLTPQEPDVDDPGPEPTPEAAVTPVVAEDLCYRCDDNTENDFTDFTTASNERSAVLEVPTANDVSFDDDFAQLESTPSADSNFVSQSKTDFATFDADFSKFDSFQASFPATFDDPGSVPKDICSKQLASSDGKSTPEAPNEEDLTHDDFDDFQDFTKFSTEISAKHAETSSKISEKQPSADDADNDDDFGEFSDFKQSEVLQVTGSIPTSRSNQFSQESILSVITGMFPSCAEEPHSDTGQLPSSCLLQNKIYHELKDMDTTQALSYQYNNSDSNKSLVRALGIDSRNILFGSKWNSSMPRFAANLSFSPLEPLKPTSASSTSSTVSSNSMVASSSSSSVGKLDATSKHHAFGLDPILPAGAGNTMSPTGSTVAGTVPTVQFDWNSSGLVNPLEGVQEILQESGAFQPNKNGPEGEILDQKISENPGTPASDEVVTPPQLQAQKPFASEAIATTKAHSFDYGDSDGNNDSEFEFVSSPQLTSIPTTTSSTVSPLAVASPAAALAVGHSSSSCSSPLAASTNNVVRTIKLPETHIFTPSKCVNPVSRDSTDRTETYGEFGGESRFSGTLDKSIAVREYHDVEYSLDKNVIKMQGVMGVGSVVLDDDDDFGDFREYQAVRSGIHIGSNSVEKTEDQKLSDLTRFRLDVGSDSNYGDRKDRISSYSKPVFGRSPTEELDQMDDEFSDFQAAAPVSDTIKPIVNKSLSSVTTEQNRSNTSSPILLCPSILLPQQAKSPPTMDTSMVTQINWPDPGVDPDELARFEAAFPTPKVAVQSTSSNNSPKHAQHTTATTADDDEWTDFVYSKPSNEKPSPTHRNTEASSSTVSNQQEEWTDFIYSTPATQNLSSSHNNFNYQNSFGASRLDGPKFNSWNQAQLPPPQFSSWNSNSYYFTAPTSNSNSFPKSLVQTQKVPTFPAAHAPPLIPSGNNYYQASPQGVTISSSQNQRTAQSSIPGITHLPELSFITPNAIAGSSAPGVKPLAHSFLSNVISSNNFTKK